MAALPESRPRDRDRGFAVAYARHCFYRLLEQWATSYDVKTTLEGPLDGIDGVPGVHGACLARRGIDVLSMVCTASDAETARRVYDSTGGGSRTEIRVATDLADDLPVSDLVVAYDALARIPDHRAYVGRLARLARRVLVITVPNPTRWALGPRGLATRLLRRAKPADGPSQTAALAPLLWEIGRVREHVYFDCPSWGGSPPSTRAEPADRFVYGPERWPHFGGSGWSDELLPALLRRPGFDGSETKLLPRLARMHAFVVDVRPRTPQARRRPQLLASAPDPHPKA